MTRSAHGSASRAGGEGQIAKLPATIGIDRAQPRARAALQCASVPPCGVGAREASRAS